MKKAFSLCMALLCGMAMYAQDVDHTFEFVDKDGNIVPDGSVVVRNALEEVRGGYQISSGLWVKNTSSYTDYATVSAEVKGIPSGSFAICYPVNCISLTIDAYPFTGTIDNVYDQSGQGGNTVKDLQSEWGEIEEGQYGSFETIYRLRIGQITGYKTNSLGMKTPIWGDVAQGPAVTVRYEYADPAGISGVAADAVSKPVAYYDAKGNRQPAMQKGLNIVRYANGEVKKIVK